MGLLYTFVGGQVTLHIRSNSVTQLDVSFGDKINLIFNNKHEVNAIICFTVALLLQLHLLQQCNVRLINRNICKLWQTVALHMVEILSEVSDVVYNSTCSMKYELDK